MEALQKRLDAIQKKEEESPVPVTWENLPLVEITHFMDVVDKALRTEIMRALVGEVGTTLLGEAIALQLPKVYSELETVYYNPKEDTSSSHPDIVSNQPADKNTSTPNRPVVDSYVPPPPNTGSTTATTPASNEKKTWFKEMKEIISPNTAGSNARAFSPSTPTQIRYSNPIPPSPLHHVQNQSGPATAPSSINTRSRSRQQEAEEEGGQTTKRQKRG